MEGASEQPVQRRKVKAPNNAEDEQGDVTDHLGIAGAGVGVGAGAMFGGVLGSVVPGAGTAVGVALGAAVGGVAARMIIRGVAGAAGVADEQKKRLKHIQELLKQQQRFFAIVLVALVVVLSLLCAVTLWLVYGGQKSDPDYYPFWGWWQ